MDVQKYAVTVKSFRQVNEKVEKNLLRFFRK